MMMPILHGFATLEVDLRAGEPTAALLESPQQDELLLVSQAPEPSLGFWEGLWVDSLSLQGQTPRGHFLWRLFSQRQGTRAGLKLSMRARDDEEAGARDPLWMVGELGRQGLAAPPARQLPPEQMDDRSLFLHGEGRRWWLEDAQGELWGSLDEEPGAPRLTLRTWRRRALGWIQPLQRSQERARFHLEVGQMGEDSLEEAALVACALALAWRR